MIKIDSDKYHNLYITGGRCYGYTGFARNEDITDQIVCVKLLDSLREGYGTMTTIGTTIGSAIVGGFAGAIGTLACAGKDVTMHCRVYMHDDTTFEIITNEKQLIKFLQSYVIVKRRR